MLRLIFALLLIFLLCPTKQWASHKPFPKSILLYIVTEMFKDAGGLETFSMMFQIEDAKSDEDLDLIYKAKGIDGKKADIALRGTAVAIELFNSGFSPESVVTITKNVQLWKPKMKGSVAILTFWLNRKGQEVDSTQVAEALRQGELLKHMGIDPHSAFTKNGIDLEALDSRNKF